MARLALAFLAVLATTACATATLEREDNIRLPERADEVRDAGADGEVTTQSAEASVPDDPEADASTMMVDAAPAVDAAPPTGKWLAAVGQDCASFCSQRGATNVASPDGAKCTSGENIPNSALTGGITYDKCFPSCNAHVSGTSPRSFGKNCYADGQKQDGDDTDVTRGCFCL